MIDFDLKYRILPEPHDELLSVYHLLSSDLAVDGVARARVCNVASLRGLLLIGLRN